LSGVFFLMRVLQALEVTCVMHAAVCVLRLTQLVSLNHWT
jgi:hypothetical protein